MNRTLDHETVDTNLIEPITIMPTFSHGIATIDIIGSNVHLTFYVEQPIPGLRDGRRERLINARVIIPIEAISTAWPWVLRTIGAPALSEVAKPVDMLLS